MRCLHIFLLAFRRSERERKRKNSRFALTGQAQRKPSSVVLARRENHVGGQKEGDSVCSCRRSTQSLCANVEMIITTSPNGDSFEELRFNSGLHLAFASGFYVIAAIQSFEKSIHLLKAFTCKSWHNK